MSLVGRGCEGKSCADRDCDGCRDNGGGRRTRAQLPTRGQVGFTPTSRARGPGWKIARRRRRGWGLSRRRLRCRGPARKFPIGGTMTFHSKLQKSNHRAGSCRVDPTASLCPWMRSLFPFPAAQGPDRPDAEAGSAVCIGPRPGDVAPHSRLQPGLPSATVVQKGVCSQLFLHPQPGRHFRKLSARRSPGAREQGGGPGSAEHPVSRAPRPAWAPPGGSSHGCRR